MSERANIDAKKMNRTPTRREILQFMIFSSAYYFLFTYKSFGNFFFFDDLDTLSWIQAIPNLYLLKDTFDLSYFANSSFYRPFGSLLHGICLSLFGLNFVPFHIIATLIHLINVILVYILISKFVSDKFSVSLGAILFVFHVSLMPIYWYFYGTFDSLCATFLLISFLFYIKPSGRFYLYLLSLLCFFLALRSKEMPLTFPLVLTFYELFIPEKDSTKTQYLEGGRLFPPSSIKRIVRRLWPFYVISLCAGLLKLTASTKVDSLNTYAVHLNISALIGGLHFFITSMLQFPWLPVSISLLLLIFLGILPVILKSRALAFAYFYTLTSLLPILPLANRREGYHLYIPLIGVSIYAAELFYCLKNRIKQKPYGDTFYLHLTVILLFFIYVNRNWDIKGHIEKRYLRIAKENREFYELIASHPVRENTIVLYDSAPKVLNSHHGVFAIFHLLYHDYRTIVKFTPDCRKNIPLPVENDICCVSYKNRTVQIWRPRDSLSKK